MWPVYCVFAHNIQLLFLSINMYTIFWTFAFASVPSQLDKATAYLTALAPHLMIGCKQELRRSAPQYTWFWIKDIMNHHLKCKTHKYFGRKALYKGPSWTFYSIIAHYSNELSLLFDYIRFYIKCYGKYFTGFLYPSSNLRISLQRILLHSQCISCVL